MTTLLGCAASVPQVIRRDNWQPAKGKIERCILVDLSFGITKDFK